MIEVTVVVTVYRARDVLDCLRRRLQAALEGLRYEIVFVDDACPQGCGPRLDAWTQLDPRLRVLHLERNVGQMRALEAGLRAAAGSFIAVLDCDLQDPPEDIPVMLEIASRGHPIVCGCPDQKSNGPVREILTRLFLALLYRLAPAWAGPRASTLSVLSREALQAYLACPEAGKAYIHPLRTLGFPIFWHHYHRRARDSSSQSWARLARFGRTLLGLAWNQRGLSGRSVWPDCRAHARTAGPPPKDRAGTASLPESRLDGGSRANGP